MDNNTYYNLYSYFDKIYCLNLITRKDRYESAKKIFNKLNIPHVEFYITEKSKINGRFGCFNSHINIIKNSFNKGYFNILITEDDIRPTKYYNLDLVKKSIDFMKNNKWDIFYFGYIPFNKNFISDNIFFNNKKINDNIINYSPCGTHAYCLNKHSMIKILNNYEKYINNTHYDVFLTNHKIFKNYCLVPMIFDQIWCSPSDNSVHDITEVISRKLQCVVGDKLNLGTKTTIFVYLANKYKYTKYLIILIFIILFLILYILNKN
jgi:GR25 family glycosyltransferase involved in LPS biosynthesis